MTKPEPMGETLAPDVDAARERLALARADVNRLQDEASDALAAVEEARAAATSHGDLEGIEDAAFTARKAEMAVDLAQRAVESARHELDHEVAEERAMILARAEARRDVLLATIRELAGKLGDAGEELETLHRETKRAYEHEDKSGRRHRLGSFLKGVPLRQIEQLDDWRIGYRRPRSY
jgi:hypothetical protein